MVNEGAAVVVFEPPTLGMEWTGAAYPDGNIMEGLVAGSWLLICSGVLYGGATLADCLAWLEARS